MKRTVEIEDGQILVVSGRAGMNVEAIKMAMENFSYVTGIQVVLLVNGDPEPVSKTKWNPFSLTSATK